jgi:hypothetical protein
MPANDLAALDDEALAAAIAAQKEAVAAFEAEFVPMRQRYERLRQRLRALEGELTRRRQAAEGKEPARPAQRRGGILVSDVIAGRERLDPLRPLSSFHFTSLGRQQVYLNRDGEPAEAAISFYERDTRAQHLASTFHDAARLLGAGLAPGVPGVPMERQGVYYVTESKPGWLRLDQIFVEDPTT